MPKRLLAVNRRVLMKELHKQEHKAIRPHMQRILRKHYQDAKDKMIADIAAHPVSMELQSEGATGNISGTLPAGKGNLFGFLSFPQGFDPIAKLINDVDRYTSISRIRKMPNRYKNLTYRAEVRHLTQESLYYLTPLRWSGEISSGMSWIQAVEKGLDNFPSYIYWKFAGQSGQGLQAKKKGSSEPQILRSGQHAPIEYITQILNAFDRNISKASGKMR